MYFFRTSKQNLILFVYFIQMEDQLEQPTTFSNVSHEFVLKKRMNSLFFVTASLKQSYKAEVSNHLTNTLGVMGEQADDFIGEGKVSTGFVIMEKHNSYSILTTAHVFERFYSATVKLSPVQLNRWFTVYVACQHYEQNMARELPNLYSDPSVDPRKYSPATIERFDQQKDLMLLRVNKKYLFADNNESVCSMPHPPIPLCRRVPTAPSDVVMIAWPPCRRDTPFVGRLVSKSRVYGQITQVQPKGYNMELVEVDITGDFGCSGGPILNQVGQLLSVYHGRLNSVGYGITASEVHQFTA